MKDTKFLATVDYEPNRLRRKNNWTDKEEVANSIDSALYESSMTSHISVNAVPEAFGMFMELSTAHIKQSTMELIDEGKLGCATWSNDYGAFVSAAMFYDIDAEGEPHGFPDDLVEVLTYAKANGARYVLLDCDALEIESLPKYEW